MSLQTHTFSLRAGQTIDQIAKFLSIGHLVELPVLILLAPMELILPDRLHQLLRIISF
jgi:hypothetical protein